MLKEGMNGFCMALADSVPGVSGGTVAFIMGFYDRFIGSIHNLAFGKMREKKSAFMYLAKLGVGWLIGMAMAVVVLSTLFESHIYAVSSLFIGFIAGAIPLIIKEEKNSFREIGKGILFCLIGIVLVAGITWANGKIVGGSMDLGQFSVGLAVKLFFIGMIAISAIVSSGYIRFYTAFDFWGIYSGYYSSERFSFFRFILSSVSDVFWVRCVGRGVDSGKSD